MTPDRKGRVTVLDAWYGGDLKKWKEKNMEKLPEVVETFDKALEDEESTTDISQCPYRGHDGVDPTCSYGGDDTLCIPMDCSYENDTEATQ